MHGSELLNIASYCLGGVNYALGPNFNVVLICTCIHNCTYICAEVCQNCLLHSFKLPEGKYWESIRKEALDF